MTAYAASADDLIGAASVETADVDLPTGQTVKVRGLTRFELILNGKDTEDAALIERRNVATCMLEPPMTVKQVEQWQKAPGSVKPLAAITAAIRDLSGLGEGAGKSDVAEAGD